MRIFFVRSHTKHYWRCYEAHPHEGLTYFESPVNEAGTASEPGQDGSLTVYQEFLNEFEIIKGLTDHKALCNPWWVSDTWWMHTVQLQAGSWE